MNKRQRNILINTILFLVMAFILVTAFMSLKDFINRKEAIRGMRELSERIAVYQKQNSSLPPESWVQDELEKINAIRLGEVNYRGQWIDPQQTQENSKLILAYTRKSFSPLVGQGSVVLFVSGDVKWMERSTFDMKLDKQESEAQMRLILRQQPPLDSLN